MPTFEEIYAKHAAEYDALVSHEDYQGNILKALTEVAPFKKGRRVVEFGAGTGRVSLLVQLLVRHLVVSDFSEHMLGVATEKLRTQAVRQEGWAAFVADNRQFPMQSGVADISIAGWSFGHATEWQADRWQADIGQAVDEMLRVLKPGGTAIILETMGTGSEEPAPPNENLAAYYHWLENERSFSYRWIRTDYKFESLEQAEYLNRFFFGDTMGDAVRDNNWVVLPECTGIWWRTT